MNKTSEHRPRRSPQEWPEIIKQAETSLLSIERFCEQQNISVQTYYAWRKRLRQVKAMAGFVPVVVAQKSAEPPAQAAAHVEIVLRNGRIVRIAGDGIDLPRLRTLLNTVEEDAAC